MRNDYSTVSCTTLYFCCDFMILGYGVGAFATVYAADEA